MTATIHIAHPARCSTRSPSSLKSKKKIYAIIIRLAAIKYLNLTPKRVQLKNKPTRFNEMAIEVSACPNEIKPTMRRTDNTAMQYLVIAIKSLLLLLSAASPAAALRFTSIQMPALVQRGTSFWLACQFQLDPAEQLYSVKWYKNNEEFYRLLMGSTSSPASASGLDGPMAAAGPATDNFQQQQFAQAGINVMMSGSNATHVRLLNASLESEGVYACEISSENLSSIRHEKEIKVYVLPHLKLSVIGLRNSYALDERVELHCLSDFSRPLGALAWFINDQRITTSSRPNFELEWKRTSGNGGGGGDANQLGRVSLALKFKLTNEILVAASGRANQRQRARSQPLEPQPLRNQSLKLSSSQQHQQQQQAGNLLQLLKLECKFKLTDVSDVTFNELKLVRSQSADGAHRSAGRLTDTSRPLSRRGFLDANDDLADQLVVETTATAAAPGTLVAKSHGQQVVQANRRPDAFKRLRPAGRKESPAADGACQRGPLALQLEDPIILDVNASSTSSDLMVGTTSAIDADESNLDANNQRANNNGAPNTNNELIEGRELNLNCSTLGALLLSADQRDEWLPAITAAGDQRPANWPLAPTRRKFANRHSESEPAPAHSPDDQVEVCADLVGRRRSLISGKYQTQQSGNNNNNNDSDNLQALERARGQSRVAPSSSAQQQQQRQLRNQQQNHQIAYVKLEASEWLAVLAQQQFGASSAGGVFAESTRRNGAAGQQVTKSLAQLDQQQQQLQRLLARESLRAPPLLEWFINNQEAPKSSASYSPALPLAPAMAMERRPPVGGGRAARQRTNSPDIGRLDGGRRFDLDPLGGGSSGQLGGQEAGSLLPSVDYAEYFANFDSRPLDQHLKLSLKLDKKHFMTPDGQLTLRCTSTQAQVLWVDSVSVSLLAHPAGELPQHQQQPAQPHWQQRPLINGNQIKQKYLHQYPRSSSQKFASPSPNYRQEQTFRVQQVASNGGGGGGGSHHSSQSALEMSTLALLILQISALIWARNTNIVFSTATR